MQEESREYWRWDKLVRGALVVTVAIRDPELAQAAIGLAGSLSVIGDRTPRCIITDLPQYDWRRYFDMVVQPRDICLGDVDQVIWLDPRSLAFKRMDQLFNSYRDAGVVFQERPANKGPEPGFAYVGLKTLSPEQRSLVCGFVKNGSVDVESIHRAMQVQMAPPRTVCNSLGERVDSLNLDVLSNCFSFGFGGTTYEPPLFSAVGDHYSREYRHQISALKWVSRFEDRHPQGYMSFSQRMARSIQRRLLRLSGRLG